jgi:AraC-like DNA-binding protein
MLTEYLKHSTIFENSPPREVSTYVQRHVGMHELKLDGRGGRATLRYATLGKLGLSVISYGNRALVENPIGIDDYHLHLVIGGNCLINIDNQEVHLAPGSGMLVNPATPTAVTYSADSIKLLVKIPKSLFSALSLDLFGHLPPNGVRFAASAYSLESRPSARRAIELLYLEADEHRTGAQLSDPALEFFFVSRLLESFPNNVSRQVVGSRNDLLFVRLDNYIDTHIREEISAAQLALEGHVSLRTLYDRFAIYKGMSPSAYVKEKKLRKIYARLSNVNLPGQSITEIALEYGFTHLGRFSAEYKAIFGQLPSETAHVSRMFRAQP